jgi:hypothetical protein
VKADVLRRLAAFSTRKPLTILGLLAMVSLGIYAAIAKLSWQFMPGGESIERPILVVVVLLGVVFACYLIGIFVAIHARDDRRLLAIIVLTGIAFRLSMLYSWPIQEIDIYRYLWDGAVTVSGISPYRYSPEQVLARSGNEPLPGDLQRLVALRDSSPALATILSRVHYGELPTIYPPVSQAVFAFVTLLTPEETGVLGRIVIMKVALVLFDLATLIVVIGLVRLAGKHVGWSLAYAWCPLVIKEIANTGHLDAVTVFLMTLALFFVVRLLTTCKMARTAPRGVLLGFVSAVLLGLAVGAKLYPIVLGPLFAVTWWRWFGWRKALLLTIGLLVIVALLLWPMVPAISIPQAEEKEPPAIVNGDLPPPPENTVTTDAQDPSRGLKTFLRRWEINDFLFMLMVENLKPAASAGARQQPWFAVTPEAWRGRLLEAPVRWLQLDIASTSFLVTRFITAALFVFIALWLAWHARLSDDPNVWLRAAFLTLAWLWLLSPTQNPWYWTWALPLVMFTRSKAWLVISGLVLMYYLRFWFSCHWPDASVPGTGYRGTAFFDFVVTWLEFGPWFIWLGIDGCRWRRTVTANVKRPP